MSRQRQVFPRDTVAHLWTNASQDSARDSSGNFYYSGPMLYSYGSHHVIAYRMENADGSVSYLWNANTHSITTNRHHAVAWHAVRVIGTVIPLPDCAAILFTARHGARS